MLRQFLIYISYVLLLALSGSGYAVSQNKLALYQLGNASALFSGAIEGDINFKEVKSHGNFGLGTFNGTKGEMVALDGNFYQIGQKGKTNPVDLNWKTPYVEVVTIAIIGMGLTGNSIFCQLVQKLILEKTSHAEMNIQIHVFEKDPVFFATGAPFKTDAPPIWTLNDTTKKFKLTPNGRDLATWMEVCKSKWQDRFPDVRSEYVPRSLAGLYLKDEFELYEEIAKSHEIIVKRHYLEIADIDSVNENWELKADNGEIYKANTLFICLGHATSNQFQHLKSKPNYFNNTSNLESFDSIPSDSPVYFIGGQATFVDYALWFSYAHHHNGPIHMDVAFIPNNSGVVHSCFGFFERWRAEFNLSNFDATNETVVAARKMDNI